MSDSMDKGKKIDGTSKPPNLKQICRRHFILIVKFAAVFDTTEMEDI